MATLVLVGCGGGYEGDELVGQESSLQAFCFGTQSAAALNQLGDGSDPAEAPPIEDAERIVDKIVELLRDQPDAEIADAEEGGRTIREYAVDQQSTLSDDCDDGLAERLQKVIDSTK